MAILAFSILVGPPAEEMTFWCNTTPSMSSVSSIVPPIFFTTLISRKSTFEAFAAAMRVTASTAMGARVEEYCETIYKLLLTHATLSILSKGEETDLGVQRSSRSPQQTLPILKIHRRRKLSEELDSSGRGTEERLGDDSRVKALCQHLLRCAEESAGEDDDGGRAVTGFDVLCRGEVDELHKR